MLIVLILIELIFILFITCNFYYIAFKYLSCMRFLSCYISELYLFVVTQNVGFQKRFSGL